VFRWFFLFLFALVINALSCFREHYPAGNFRFVFDFCAPFSPYFLFYLQHTPVLGIGFVIVGQVQYDVSHFFECSSL